jgi:hypothetical protein
MATMRRVPGPASGAFNKAMKELADANVRIGWFDNSKYDDANNTPVAYVAAINELGPNKRPFMQPTADKQDTAWGEMMGYLAKQIVTGKMTVETALNMLGLRVRDDIRDTITEITANGGLSKITLITRAYRREGKVVTGRTIGEIAALIKSDPAKANEIASTQRDTPLNDYGVMFATLLWSVNGNEPEGD